ncbi:J domain-containing protein [Pseudanabaena minima]|uniref:J domain-containing protein n=1 Tax=Pseudanabaena minima TaxID=890415 RepID=UPI003DA97B00
MEMNNLRYPLHYPAGWQRNKFRQKSRFSPRGDRTFANARDELFRQLDLLGASQVVLSSNIPLRKDGLPYASFRQPDDPSIAVYFRLNKIDLVLACDYWDKVVDNTWAIAKHIDAMRGMHRWGVGSMQQAFMGYQALPSELEWWQILGVSQDASVTEVKAAYVRLSKEAHPDLGGSKDRQQQINKAFDIYKSIHK